MMDAPPPNPNFEYYTLETATEEAQHQARADGRERYVVAVRTSETGEDLASGRILYGCCDVPALTGLIAITDPGPDAAQRWGALAILRVARPDGTVEDVEDPGDEAARLAAFGHEQGA